MDQLITAGNRCRPISSRPPEVRARFERLKAREVILDVQHLNKLFGSRGAIDHRAQRHQLHHPSARVPLRRRALGLRQVHAGAHPGRPGGDRARAQVLLQGKAVTEPGSDRGMVFQGYTLFPWLTVKKNVMFGLEVNGRGKDESEQQALQWLAADRAREVRRRLSAPALRRHEAAGGDRAGARQSAAHPA